MDPLNQGSSWTRREQEVFRRGSDEFSSPTPLQDDSTREDAEPKHDFWSITGDFICRHHVEPRVKLCSPREESFPVPPKYIDVTRTTHTSLDVLLEKHIEDYWNADWDNLHKIKTGTKDHLTDIHGFRAADWRGLKTSGQNMWKHMSDAANSKANQKWAIEKPKLDNARRLRGHARGTLLELRWNCHGETCRNIGKRKTK